MDRGAQRATVHRVAKSQIQLKRFSIERDTTLHTREQLKLKRLTKPTVGCWNN